MRFRTRTVVIALTSCIGLAIALSMVASNQEWFLRVREASIDVNGRPVEGRLYRSTDGRTFYLTAQVTTGRRRSYRIGPVVNGRETTAADCLGWTTPSVPIIALNRYEPPCWRMERGASGEYGERPIYSVNASAGKLQFTDKNGEIIAARWDK